MKTRSHAPNISEPEISEAEAAAMVAQEAKPKTPKVEPETLRAYSAYLSDWKQRMATFTRLQREYM